VLESAISFGVIRAVEALLDAGAPIDGVDGDGVPIAYGLRFGYVQLCELLAKRGAKLDLRFAAGIGRLDLVESWFNADGSLKPGAGSLADPYGQERKQRGESPFQCEWTRENILSQALCFACLHHRLEVAAFLVSQGANVNAIVPGLDINATILHLIASTSIGPNSTIAQVFATVRFLLEHGVDLTIRDTEYHSTPIDWAAHCKLHAVADLLRSHAARYRRASLTNSANSSSALAEPS
jgi:ankyrin repeat protein